MSGLGKGVTASSVGVLLKAAGMRVTAIKIGACCPLARTALGRTIHPASVRHSAVATSPLPVPQHSQPN